MAGLLVRDRRGLEEARNLTTVVFDHADRLRSYALVASTARASAAASRFRDLTNVARADRLHGRRKTKRRSGVPG